MASITPTGRRAAAFFDLDKTVIARSSTLAFVRPLHRAGLLQRRTMLKAAAAQAVYRTLGADQHRLDRVRDQLADLTTGLKVNDIRRLVQEAVDEVISPLVYAEALSLIEDHRREGREIVIVSISPEEVVRPLARYLGIDHIIATRSALDQEGRYTGRVAFYASGPAKAEAIRSLVRERDLDLQRCFAYSDSYTDLPMLEEVGHPVAVNPDRELRRVAAERGWPVVEFDSPVTLQDRLATLPRPTAPVLSGTALATAVVGAIALWALKARRRVRRVT